MTGAIKLLFPQVQEISLAEKISASQEEHHSMKLLMVWAPHSHTHTHTHTHTQKNINPLSASKFKLLSSTTPVMECHGGYRIGDKDVLW